MRSLLLFLLGVASTQATFGLLASLFGGGCGPCGGGGGMYGGAGYGGDYGGGYGGSPMMGMNAPGSYFQPVGQALGVQSYFTPADGGYGGYGGYGSSYGGSYGSSYGGGYGGSYANAQIGNNIPYMPQATGGSYAQPAYRRPLPIPRARPSSYVQPQVEEPVPPPPPPPPAEEGYAQPAAPVRPYVSVPHAAPETAPPAEAPAQANESEDYSETETETQAPAVQTTTNYAAAQSTQEESNQVHMINSPEEAGYRKVLKRRLVRKKTLA